MVALKSIPLLFYIMVFIILHNSHPICDAYVTRFFLMYIRRYLISREICYADPNI